MDKRNKHKVLVDRREALAAGLGALVGGLGGVSLGAAFQDQKENEGNQLSVSTQTDNAQPVISGRMAFGALTGAAMGAVGGSMLYRADQRPSLVRTAEEPNPEDKHLLHLHLEQLNDDSHGHSR